MQDNPEKKKQEQEQIIELGSDITKSKKGSIYRLKLAKCFRKSCHMWKR